MDTNVTLIQAPLHRAVDSDFTQVVCDMKPTVEILVVDYDPAARLMVRTLLEHQSYRVIEAGSTYEALRLVRGRKPALVVLREDFPLARGGWIVCDRVWEAHPEVPVLILSADPRGVTPPTAAGPHRTSPYPVKSQRFAEDVAALIAKAE